MVKPVLELLSYNKSKQDHVYFPSLNGLRFIAASVVIIHHTEQIKQIFSLHNYWNKPFIVNMGGLGVTLFFVLSGYLITYLLLKEKEFNQISLKKFYIRRILRIWPLYYLMTILGFFVLPYILPVNEIPSVLDSHFFTKLLLFIFLLPNISLQFFYPVTFIAPLWSVGIEEQFYLIWPIIIKRTNIIKTIVIIIISFACLRYFLSFGKNNLANNIKSFVEYFRVDCMAMGGFFAYCLFKKNSVLKLLYYKVFQGIVYLTMLVLFLKGYTFPFYYTVWSFLFGVLILNTSSNPHSLIKLENKVFNQLGKISYGLYMFHGTVIFLLLYFFKDSINRISNKYLRDIILDISIFAVTITISFLSYYYFERRFLIRKRKYELITNINP